MTYVWSETCQEAFEELKKQLTEAPSLSYPSFDCDFILETDASIWRIGAMLSQLQADKLRLSTAEQNYAIADLETLVVVWRVSLPHLSVRADSHHLP